MADLKMYGLNWPNVTDPLMVERLFVRGKGYYKKGGKTYGNGLYHHMRQMITYCWPEDDHHRWSDLGLKRICENEITVLLGSSDSGKTFLASRFVLIDWWAHAENTLWLVSSTEMRGAELRIWGKIKELFNRARKLHPWLPGTVLDSKHAITTEEMSEDGSEARLLTKGLIFLPCRSNGRWVGMGQMAGIKPTKGGRLGHCGDECFPAGTLVDTPTGKMPIEFILSGDRVINATGEGVVLGVMQREADSLMRIKTVDGREIICTPNHKFLTQKGWEKACEVNELSYMVSPNEAMQILRNPTSKQNILLSFLQREILHYNSNWKEGVLHQEKAGENYTGTICCSQAESAMGGEHIKNVESVLKSKTDDDGEEGFKEIKGDRMEAACQGRERMRSYEGGKNAHFDTSPGIDLELRDQDRKMEWERISSSLQSGHCDSRDPVSDRSRWELALQLLSKEEGSEKGSISGGAWVDSCEVIEQEDFERISGGKKSVAVYNLHVETNHSYSVEGLVCSNCSFMERSFLDAYSNWYGKENFRGILTGNPTDIEDPLCAAAEPVDGWDSWHDTEKTQEWRTKFYGGWAVAFDGRDSPNFDYPADQPTKFPYLIGRKKLEAVEKTEGKDSPLWWMMCIGKPLPGISTMKVITRQMCEQNKAFEDVVWEGNQTTHVLGLDAAYGGIGGDRCILFHSEFGTDIEGKSIFACRAPILVPVSVKNLELAETQIAKFCMQYADGMGINAENFFFDARATLGVELARIWSPQVNAVDFGGTATKRPVSMDEYVWEGDSQGKRLKRCDEHYSKFVTELWYTVRYAIMGQQMRRLPRDAAAEGSKRLWRFTKGQPPRIEIEPKAEMKKRTKESPDLFDALAICVEGARRLGFVIENMKEERASNQNEEDWLNEAVDKQRIFMRQHELQYNL